MLVEAIVKMADEPDIPEIPLPQNTFNRPQQSIQLSPEDWSNIQMVYYSLVLFNVVGEFGIFKRGVFRSLSGM